MKIHIDDKKTLAQIQEEFHKAFPYLKVEFFKTPHETGKGSEKKDMIDASKTVGDIRKKHNEGDISIKTDSVIGELEQEFQDKYGISAQIFRKSGDSWLATSKTDDWTVEKQNETAKEMEVKYNVNVRNYARKD